MKIAHDEHHREQEHDGAEIDGFQDVPTGNNAEGDHCDGADDGSSGTIDFQTGKFADSENEVAGEEDDVRGKNATFGKRGWVEMDHEGARLTAGRPWL